MEPRIIINAKAYPQVEGPGVLSLAEACSDVAVEAGIDIGLAPPQVELATVGRADLPRLVVFGQHLDDLLPGAGTGWVTPEAVRAAGAAGTLLNHAEHKIPHDGVAARIARARDTGLMTLVCADGMEETKALAPLAPTYLAVEPPELIGGDTSVTSADPAIVRDASSAVLKLSPFTKPLCGAGVKDGRDVAAALELGAYGVLLASGVVKHADPGAALRELASGL